MAQNMGRNARNIEGEYGKGPSGSGKGLTSKTGALAKPAASGGTKASGKQNQGGGKSGAGVPGGMGGNRRGGR